MSTRPPEITYIDRYVPDTTAVVRAMVVAMTAVGGCQWALDQANNREANEGREPLSATRRTACSEEM